MKVSLNQSPTKPNHPFTLPHAFLAQPDTASVAFSIVPFTPSTAPLKKFPMFSPTSPSQPVKPLNLSLSQPNIPLIFSVILPTTLDTLSTIPPAKLETPSLIPSKIFDRLSASHLIASIIQFKISKIGFNSVFKSSNAGDITVSMTFPIVSKIGSKTDKTELIN